MSEPSSDAKPPARRRKDPDAIQPGWTSKRVERSFKKRLRSRELYASIDAIIANPNHQHFPTILKLMLDRALGPVKQTVELDVNESKQIAPTALPPVLHRKEVVREIYNETGELVKRYGKVKTEVLPAPRDDVQDADFEYEETPGAQHAADGRRDGEAPRAAQLSPGPSA